MFEPHWTTHSCLPSHWTFASPFLCPRSSSSPPPPSCSASTPIWKSIVGPLGPLRQNQSAHLPNPTVAHSLYTLNIYCGEFLAARDYFLLPRPLHPAERPALVSAQCSMPTNQRDADLHSASSLPTMGCFRLNTH